MKSTFRYTILIIAIITMVSTAKQLEAKYIASSSQAGTLRSTIDEMDLEKSRIFIDPVTK